MSQNKLQCLCSNLEYQEYYALLTFSHVQRVDLSFDRPEYEHPSGHYNDLHRCSLYLTGCHVPHHVQKGTTNLEVV